MLMMTPPPFPYNCRKQKYIWATPYQSHSTTSIKLFKFSKKNIAFTCSPLYKFYSLRMQCCSWSFHVTINTVHL